jgi:hypothetical protein
MNVKKSVLSQFSLWECLGVLAILGSLTVALLPVLARARTAPDASSLSHRKHLHTALSLYTADYDEDIAPRKRLINAAAFPLSTSGGCLVDDAKFVTAYNSMGAPVGCQDNATGRIWAVSRQAETGSSSTMDPKSSGVNAIEYCAALTPGGTPAGSWEVPTRDELYGVALNGAGSHFIQPPVNPTIQCSRQRWTRTKAPGNKLYWVILGDPEDAMDGVPNGIECPTQVGSATRGSVMDVICVLKAGAPIP